MRSAARSTNQEPVPSPIRGTTRLADGTPWAPDDPSPLICNIDAPQSLNVVADEQGLVHLIGWTASIADVPHQVTIIRDGRVQYAPVMSRRDDVTEYFRANEETRFLGGAAWNLSVYLYLPPNEQSRTFELTVSDGEHVCDIGTFTVSRATSRSTKAAKEMDRARYKDVWNSVSGTVDEAKTAVAGYTDEDEFNRTAFSTVQMLTEAVGINPEDVFLEIGAGVGRVAVALAPLCKKFIMTDVSEQMLGFAKERNAGLKNVEYVPLSGWDLEPIDSDSVDVVYCTVVFMHLDEWERYGYICEALRILRPGGRLLVDNYNLLSEPGWDFFSRIREHHHPLNRPPNVSRSSTPQELETFLVRAGFQDVKTFSSPESLFCMAAGVKPTA
jgi:SAM-dependent methyltransferase